MPRDVFISHASGDASVAVEVCALLEGHGLQCWMAPRDVTAGAVWDEAILDAIERSCVFLLILSSNANQSQFVKNEVNRAFSQNKPIVTFRLEEVVPGRSLELYLARHHWADGFPGPLTARVEVLSKAIAAHLNPKAGASSAAESASTVPAASIRAAPMALSRSWWRGKKGGGIAAAVLLALLAGTGWLYRSRASGGAAIDSVAVLPFVNGSGDPNMEYLSDGIAESLTSSLSQLPRLQVKSRDSAFHYKGKDTDPETIGRELGVRAVFKGRVMQVGDNLTVSAELIDTQNDNQLWGQEYDRKVADILKLRDDLATQMAAALRVRLTGDDEKRLTKSYTANAEAYQAYLLGRYWWNKRTEEGFNKAIKYFQQAIAKDPNYALAYSGVADSYSLLPNYSAVPPKEALPKAKEAALKAVELDDTLAESHASLGFVKSAYEWDWSGGEREFQRAIALNDNYATVHLWYGFGLRDMGRVDEAIAQGKRAVELDPLSVVNSRELGFSLFCARQYDQAIDQEKKALELDPHFVPALDALGSVYAQKGMYKEAVAAFEEALAGSPGNLQTLADFGGTYALAGRKAEAEKILDQLIEASKHTYVQASFLARVYVNLGEKDKAFEWLGKGVDEDSLGFASTIKSSPAWDPLRSDPRWADLLRRMNLTP